MQSGVTPFSIAMISSRLAQNLLRRRFSTGDVRFSTKDGKVLSVANGVNNVRGVITRDER